MGKIDVSYADLEGIDLYLARLRRRRRRYVKPSPRSAEVLSADGVPSKAPDQVRTVLSADGLLESGRSHRGGAFFATRLDPCPRSL